MHGVVGLLAGPMLHRGNIGVAVEAARDACADLFLTASTLGQRVFKAVRNARGDIDSMNF